jgi:hypothetical protein
MWLGASEWVASGGSETLWLGASGALGASEHAAASRFAGASETFGQPERWGGRLNEGERARNEGDKKEK